MYPLCHIVALEIVEDQVMGFLQLAAQLVADQ